MARFLGGPRCEEEGGEGGGGTRGARRWSSGTRWTTRLKQSAPRLLWRARAALARMRAELQSRKHRPPALAGSGGGRARRGGGRGREARLSSSAARVGARATL